MRLARGVRARLVGTHHARIAGDVSADDGGQASFHNPKTPELAASHEPVGRPNPMVLEHMPVTETRPAQGWAICLRNWHRMRARKRRMSVASAAAFRRQCLPSRMPAFQNVNIA